MFDAVGKSWAAQEDNRELSGGAGMPLLVSDLACRGTSGVDQHYVRS